MLCKMHAAKF